MRTVAKVILSVFQPLLFPTFATALVLLLNPQRFGFFWQKDNGLWLIIIFILTFLFPVIWLLMMKQLEMIDNLKLQTTKERIIPLVATTTFYLWAAWMFKPTANMKIPPNQLLFYMMIGVCLSIFIAFFMNSFFKISLHALGAGGLLGLLLTMVRYSAYDLRIILVVFILLAGAIGSAQRVLNVHNNEEIFAGYFVGFSGQFLAFSIVPLIV
jgi:hypothetical protein